MAACSSEDLEPGPIEPLDETIVSTDPEPPTFTPIASEFSAQLPTFYSAFDDVFGALELETAVDVGGGILDALGATPATFSSGVNQEALSNLMTAEDGYRIARDKVASLKGNLEPDVQQPAGFYLFWFHVVDVNRAPIAGALVTIDADFGNGTTRVTDGNGFVNFGVPTGGGQVLGYLVTKAGYKTGSGTVPLGSLIAQQVILEAA